MEIPIKFYDKLTMLDYVKNTTNSLGQSQMKLITSTLRMVKVPYIDYSDFLFNPYSPQLKSIAHNSITKSLSRENKSDLYYR